MVFFLRVGRFLSPSRLPGRLLIFALLVVLAFWCSYFARRQLARMSREALRAHPRTFLLSGLLFRFDGNVNGTLPTGNAHSRFLVLISSDECQFSRDEAAAWIRLIRTISFKNSDAVVILTMSGTSVPSQVAEALRAQGVSYHVLSVANESRFAQETGVAWTPESIVLDSDHRVRLSAERVTRAFAKQVQDFFEQQQ
jgi:hypothetical protein